MSFLGALNPFGGGGGSSSFSGGGAFNKSSESKSVANTTHQGAQQSEVSGTATSVNGNNATVNVTDGGVVNSAFDFVRDFTKSANVLQNQTVDKAMQATLQAVQPKPIDPVILAIAGAVIVGLVYFGHK